MLGALIKRLLSHQPFWLQGKLEGSLVRLRVCTRGTTPVEKIIVGKARPWAADSNLALLPLRVAKGPLHLPCLCFPPPPVGMVMGPLALTPE